MYHRKKTAMVRFVAAVLIFAMVLPVNAGAASVETSEPVQPCASYYLESYSGSVTASGSGKIKVSFSVRGTRTMDELGVKSIMIEQSNDNVSWFWAKTYNAADYSYFLSENDDYHSGTVTYQGVAGRYYKAHITFYAGRDGGGDTATKVTSSKQAT